jgi:dTDP-4-dehydrorhamnose 3,5-epimerase
MITIEPTQIPDVKIITTKRLQDHRGFFSEIYNHKTFAEAGVAVNFVQDNHSYSAQPGTLRGLHFQSPPRSQHKLVRALRGRVLDVAVDIRRHSPTFGKHVRVELSAENWRQLLVPIGFAHGYITLEPHCEVVYKVSDFYSKEHDLGLAFDDPSLGINWSIPTNGILVSDKDRHQPRLADLPAYF